MQVFKPFIICALLIVSSLLFSSAASSDAGINQAGLMCGTYENPNTRPAKFMQSFMALMDAVAFQIKEHGWGAETLLSRLHPMFALGVCLNKLILG